MVQKEVPEIIVVLILALVLVAVVLVFYLSTGIASKEFGGLHWLTGLINAVKDFIGL